MKSYFAMRKITMKKGNDDQYTQTTDLEVETNGLMTYDRKVIKIPEEELKKMHEVLYNHAIK